MAKRREPSRREYRPAGSQRKAKTTGEREIAARRVAGSAVRTSTAARRDDEPRARAARQPSEEIAAETADSNQQDVQPEPRLLRARLLAAPPLRGSLASLVRQNEKLTAEGLVRIEDETDLSSRIAHKLLVPVPVSDNLTINPYLPAHHRYCRPWTARFLTDLARAHAALFHKPLKVSSAVRTVVYQEHLREINGNAAPAVGDIVSPHLTGATVDIAKDGLSQREIVWMRRWLLPLQAAGKIDVEEEFQQACFHIAVYKTYAPDRPAVRARSRRRTAALRSPSPYRDSEPGSQTADQSQENPAAE